MWYLPGFDPSHSHGVPFISLTIVGSRPKRKPPPDKSAVQFSWRGSGALTAVKMHAWRLIQYDLILHADLDARFLESPQAAFDAAQQRGLVFQAAHREIGRRMVYQGFNSHLMLFRPSLDVHAILMSNAAEGQRTRSLNQCTLACLRLVLTLSCCNSASDGW